MSSSSTRRLIALALFGHSEFAYGTPSSLEVAPGVTYREHEVTKEGSVKVLYRYFTVAIERSHIEYELRVLSDEIDQTGTFRLQSVAHFAETHLPPAIAAINGGTWSESPNRADSLQSRVFSGMTAGQMVYPITTVILNYDIRYQRNSDKEVVFGIGNMTGGIPTRASLIPSLEIGNSVWHDYEYYALGSTTTLLKGGVCQVEGQSATLPSDMYSAIGFGSNVVVILSTSHKSRQKNPTPETICGWLSTMGVANAVLLDGGTSTQLYVKGIGAPVNPLGLVGSTRFPKGARHVANAIGIVRAAEAACSGATGSHDATFCSTCANGEDDDGDGSRDCADSDCAKAPQCQEYCPGARDCAGRSCGPDPICRISCGTCPNNNDCDPNGRCMSEQVSGAGGTGAAMGGRAGASGSEPTLGSNGGTVTTSFGGGSGSGGSAVGGSAGLGGAALCVPACDECKSCNAGICALRPNGTGCVDDKDPCTTDSCSTGVCIHQAMSCASGQACQDGVCKCDSGHSVACGSFCCKPHQRCGISTCIDQELCNGIDDDKNGVTDDVGASGLDCFYEVWRAKNVVDAANHRLQIASIPGLRPSPPTGYAWEQAGPVFLVYREQFGITGLIPLYYRCHDYGGGLYDNFYSTNENEGSPDYDACLSDNLKAGILGYIWEASSAPTEKYGVWQFPDYVGLPTTAQPLVRLVEEIPPGHHFYTAFQPEVASNALTPQWCCESAPSHWCEKYFCTNSVASPIGYVLTPKVGL